MYFKENRKSMAEKEPPFGRVDNFQTDSRAENAAALPLKAVWIKPVEGLSGGDMVRTVIGEAGGLSSAG